MSTACDRACWLFVVQSSISILVICCCFAMLFLDIERSYAQSVLTLFVGVWLPNPNTPKVNIPVARTSTYLSPRSVQFRRAGQEVKNEET
jgi:hypothetical protein